MDNLVAELERRLEEAEDENDALDVTLPLNVRNPQFCNGTALYLRNLGTEFLLYAAIFENFSVLPG